MIEQLETRYGTMFVPDTDNGQYGWLKHTGASPEDEQIELICAMLHERPRGVAIDAGANFGCWTLALAPHCSKVYAFEPQRCVRDLLVRAINVHPHRESIVAPFGIALGPKPSWVQVPDLRLDDTTNFGGVSLGIPHSEHPGAPTYSVLIDTIDRMNIDNVSFIKVDCEGAELGIFQGTEQTIRRWKPIIVAEADHPLTDRFALGNFIESLGYNVEILRDNNFIGMPI